MTASDNLGTQIAGSFDIAITSYRRPEMVRACIASCLNQGQLLRKIIVVDDASQDSTSEVVSSFRDERIIFHQRASNGGIAAARRDAFKLSDADWTISLDSDHELLPGAVNYLSELAATTSGQAAILGARYIWDDGKITPQAVPQQSIDYRGRIECISRPDSIGSDYLCAISKQIRAIVKWEPFRSGFVDTLFQLDAAKQGRAVFTPRCLALQKSCEEHSWTRGSATKRWSRRSQDAKDAVRVLEIILERHEPALARWGVPRLKSLYHQGVFFALLSDRRRLAWQYLHRWLRLKGISWDLACLSLLSLTPISVVRLLYLLRG